MTPFKKRARELIPCTCAPDYTLRGREDPQCFWCQHGADVLQLAEEFADAFDRRREAVWLLLKHELEDSGYGSGGIQTTTPIAAYSTKVRAQAALLRQAEPGDHLSWSIEEHALDEE